MIEFSTLRRLSYRSLLFFELCIPKGISFLFSFALASLLFLRFYLPCIYLGLCVREVCNMEIPVGRNKKIPEKILLFPAKGPGKGQP